MSLPSVSNSDHFNRDKSTSKYGTCFGSKGEAKVTGLGKQNESVFLVDKNYEEK